jgi:hypothetical protein
MIKRNASKINRNCTSYIEQLQKALLYMIEHVCNQIDAVLKP